MSDSFPGKLNIGGDVPRRLVAELCTKICNQDCTLDYDDQFQPANEADLLSGISPRCGWLTLVDSSARYGEFPDLETYLASHGIAFDRHSDAYCEYNAVWHYCRPGQASEHRECPSDQSECVLVEKECVEAALELLSKGSYHEAANVLQKALPTSPLPPLKFVD